MNNLTLNNQSLNIFFDTLGCAKNHVDTSKMEKLLIENGHFIVDDARFANIIILNTCAFIKNATQESIDTFFEYRNYYKDKKIIVCGCLVSRYKNDLVDSLKEADAFVSCNEENKICDIVENFAIKHVFPKKCMNPEFCSYKYIKISDGCNRHCTYCTIPYIRGKYKSSTYDEIDKDVNSAVLSGAKEIVLVAQDCGVWGCDLDNKNLCWLLNKLCSKYKNTKFRLLYVYPETITDELIECISVNKNLVNYIDMPIQHCNDLILKKMGRRSNKEALLNIITKLRKKIPNITLRTTLISGFPGETEEQFNELCDFVEKIQFDYLGCFEYSKEEGTKAFEMTNQISESEKHFRSNRIMEIADSISLLKLSNRIGNTYEVVVEGYEDGRYFGRAEFQAPDVDGIIYIESSADTLSSKIGQYIKVKIIDIEGYDLVGEIIE